MWGHPVAGFSRWPSHRLCHLSVIRNAAACCLLLSGVSRSRASWNYEAVAREVPALHSHKWLSAGFDFLNLGPETKWRFC